MNEHAAQLFRALAHGGDLPAGTGPVRSGEAGRERHGTRVRFMLRQGDDARLQVRYRAYGCPDTLAACEWLARCLEQADPADPAATLRGLGTPREWAQHLGVPASKLGRLLVIEDALQVLLRDNNDPGTRAWSSTIPV